MKLNHNKLLTLVKEHFKDDLNLLIDEKIIKDQNDFIIKCSIKDHFDFEVRGERTINQYTVNKRNRDRYGYTRPTPTDVSRPGYDIICMLIHQEKGFKIVDRDNYDGQRTDVVAKMVIKEVEHITNRAKSIKKEMYLKLISNGLFSKMKEISKIYNESIKDYYKIKFNENGFRLYIGSSGNTSFYNGVISFQLRNDLSEIVVCNRPQYGKFNENSFDFENTEENFSFSLMQPNIEDEINKNLERCFDSCLEKFEESKKKAVECMEKEIKRISRLRKKFLESVEKVKNPEKEEKENAVQV